MSYLQVDVAAFKAQVHELLAAYPELAEDDELRADMIEAETELNALVERLLKLKLDADMMAAAVKARKQEIAERQARFERKAEGFRELIKGVMLAGDIRKLPLADATVSITAPRTKVVITDEASLPQGYFETYRKPLTADIKAALERGEAIPGAELALGDEGLMVRTK